MTTVSAGASDCGASYPATSPDWRHGHRDRLGYTQHSFSLASYIGQTITLKFTGTEDSSAQTSFVLDDMALNVS